MNGRKLLRWIGWMGSRNYEIQERRENRIIANS
jgi:hypothetical protein